MNKYLIYFVVILAVVTQACVSDEGLKVGIGMVSFDVTAQEEANQFSVVARGSSKNTQADVVEAFNLKAKNLCQENSYLLDYVVEPYQLGLSSSDENRSRKTFQATGTVVCKTVEGKL